MIHRRVVANNKSLASVRLGTDDDDDAQHSHSHVPPSKSKILPLAALAVAQVAESAWHILGFGILDDAPYISPLEFTFIRQTLTWILLTIWARWAEKDDETGGRIQLPSLRSAEFAKLVVGGVTGGCLVQLLYLQGLIMTSPTTTAVWDGPLLPVIVFCIAILRGTEKLYNPVWRIATLILTCSGSCLVLFSDYHHRLEEGGSHNSDSTELAANKRFLLGNLVILFQDFCHALMAIVQRELRQFPPLTLTSWLFGIGVVANLIVVVVTPDTSVSSVITKATRALLESHQFLVGLAFAVVVMSAFTYSILSYASRHLESSVVTLFAAAQPPITVALESFFFGTPICASKRVGIFMVCCGMYFFTNLSTKSTMEHQPLKAGKRKSSSLPSSSMEI